MLAERLDWLAEIEPQPYPVLSLYLHTAPNENGQRTVDVYLKKELNERLETFPQSTPERKSFQTDAERVFAYVTSELRPEYRTVAIFACSEAGLFETVPLEVRLERNLIVVSDRPHLYPLALLDDQYPRYAAVLADTNHTRILVFSTGRREQTIDVVGQKTKRVKVGGWSQARYQRHVENFHLHHVKEVVDVLDRVVREDHIEQVILAGDEVAVPLIEKEFPKHLADKIVDVMRLDEHLADHDVLVRTLDRLREKDAESDRAVVERLLGDYRSGGLATVGAENVLSAFEKGQVDTLLLTAAPEAIPAADDQAPSELVRQAKLTSARIRFIEDEALLRDVGGVGAFLRFRL
jgi:peptide subunit release factor 1 (eRF1)